MCLKQATMHQIVRQRSVKVAAEGRFLEGYFGPEIMHPKRNRLDVDVDFENLSAMRQWMKYLKKHVVPRHRFIDC